MKFEKQTRGTMRFAPLPAMHRPASSTKLHLTALRLPKGVIMWQLDINTGEITPAPFDDIVAGFKAGVSKQIKMRKGDEILYVPAINKKNAETKFKKMIVDLAHEGMIKKHLK